MKIHLAMKKIFNQIVLSALLLCFSACTREDIVMFNEPPSVYFGVATKTASASQNSSTYSFAKRPTKTVDTLYIPVTVSGAVSSKDRMVDVAVLDSAIADTNFVKGVEGVDFKLIEPVIVPANAYKTSLKVVLYRSATLAFKKINFFFRIIPNADFELGITAQTQWQVKVSYIQKPDNWEYLSNGVGAWAVQNSKFGTWTVTKYKIILEALYNPVADSTITEFPISRFTTSDLYNNYLQIVKNYILTKYPGNYSNPLGVGNSITDPDASNRYIQVGPANY
jgi:hypothetical protein